MAEWPESGRKRRSNTASATFPLTTALQTYRTARQMPLEDRARTIINSKKSSSLDHYEGRNWQGWHHHVTMVMVAHAFLTLETLRGKKNFWVDPAEDAT